MREVIKRGAKESYPTPSYNTVIGYGVPSPEGSNITRVGSKDTYLEIDGNTGKATVIGADMDGAVESFLRTLEEVIAKTSV